MSLSSAWQGMKARSARFVAVVWPKTMTGFASTAVDDAKSTVTLPASTPTTARILNKLTGEFHVGMGVYREGDYHGLIQVINDDNVAIEGYPARGMRWIESYEGVCYDGMGGSYFGRLTVYPWEEMWKLTTKPT